MFRDKPKVCVASELLSFLVMLIGVFAGSSRTSAPVELSCRNGCTGQGTVVKPASGTSKTALFARTGAAGSCASNGVPSGVSKRAVPVLHVQSICIELQLPASNGPATMPSRRFMLGATFSARG